MPDIFTAICATSMLLVSAIGHRTGDPHADWFMIAGFVILGCGGRYRKDA